MLSQELSKPIEGDCITCGVHFTTDEASYTKERPYKGQCPMCSYTRPLTEGMYSPEARKLLEEVVEFCRY